MRRFLVLTLLFAPLVACASGAAPASREAKQPNIVFIMADDMGSGDVHALNPASKIPTPNLDRLAREGAVFTDAHSGSAVCTPTRYGVVTGRYCWRGRLKRGVLNGYGSRLIEEGRLTVGGMLKKAGYHTGVVGKWHLGLGWPKVGNTIDFTKPIGDVPNVMGFDFSYIIPASLDFPPYVYIRDGKVTDPETVEQPAQKFPAFLRKGPRAKDFIMTEALDHLTERAAEYVTSRAKTGNPFFLYFPLTSPHKPTLPHPRFRGKSGLKDYGDFIIQTDWTVGRILKALDDAGVAKNTLIMYSSDNGSYMYRLDDLSQPDHVDNPTIQSYRADRHRANGPLRGTKADVWEAGHRVPFLARWPGVVEPGSRRSETICLTDLMATCADIAGVKLGPDAAEDSYSYLPLLRGDASGWARPPVINHSASGIFAIRDGKWKLVAGNGSGGRQRPKGKPFQRPYHLYDLDADLGETSNLIEKHPDVAKRLTAELEKIRASGRSVAR